MYHMALTPTDFKIRFPVFDDVPDSRIQFFLDDAAIEVGEAAWAGLYEKGSMLFTAHMLQIDINQTDIDDDGSSDDGNVASKSIGDVSVSFSKAAVDNTSDDWYLQTSYGSDYLRLKKRIGMGLVVIT